MEVGFVLCAYNEEEFLAEQLEAILQLETSPVQVTFVDDGSTDETAVVWRRYWDRFEDQGIRTVAVQHQRNRGISAARNSGIEVTPTEWIWPLDGDDRIKPEAVGRAAKVAEDLDVIMISYEAFGDHHGEQRYQTHRNYVNAFWRGKRLGTSCSPFRRKWWEKVKYQEDLALFEDTLFWVELAKRGARIAAISEPLLEVRYHDGRMSFAPEEKRKRAHKKLRRLARRDP